MIDEEILIKLLKEKGYIYKNFIGNGGYGSVYLVESFKFKCEFVAKIHIFKDQFKEDSYFNEVKALCNLQHPNIISIYDFFLIGNFSFIILEYCPGGNLIEKIKKEKNLKENEIKLIFKQLLSALEYCESKGISHLDIKPSNILIDKHNRPKLADFGLSKLILPGEKIEIFRGSKPFMAPEIFSKKEFNPYKADIWSLGCTILYLYLGFIPWINNNEFQMEIFIKYGIFQIPNSIPIELNNILKKMLIFNPFNRWSFKQLLSLTYFDFDLKSFKKINLILTDYQKKKNPLKKRKSLI